MMNLDKCELRVELYNDKNATVKVFINGIEIPNVIEISDPENIRTKTYNQFQFGVAFTDLDIVKMGGEG